MGPPFWFCLQLTNLKPISSTRMAVINKMDTTSVGQAVNKLEPHQFAGGMEMAAIALENSLA